jgi:hypothetical protein
MPDAKDDYIVDSTLSSPKNIEPVHTEHISELKKIGNDQDRETRKSEEKLFL